MDESSFELLTPTRIARLLDVDDPAGWSDADAAAALLHQLGTPLLPDLFAAPGADSADLAQLTLAGKSLRGWTFLEALLAQADPKILQTIKAWAKQARGQQGHPLADGPATVLYYAAIAAGLRAGSKITALSDEQLREGFTWSRRQGGADRLAELFDEALARLGS